MSPFCLSFLNYFTVSSVNSVGFAISQLVNVESLYGCDSVIDLLNVRANGESVTINEV